MKRAGLCLALSAQLFASSPYIASVEAWREAREKELKSTGGWLAVAGLFWLHDGLNAAGSNASSAVTLPPRVPSRIGDFELSNGQVAFRPAKGASVRINGKAVVADSKLKSDRDGHKPDQVQIDDLTMTVIERGGKIAIRLRDPQSEMRTHFTGLRWYPVSESWRVEARFTAEPKKIPIPNILGMTLDQDSPGYVTFELAGQTIRLDPVFEDGDLFFIFRDLTAGKTTYGAGRFLHADLPKDGKVVLDFNKAYNPPCAFTPYATCPLPPKQNRMPVRLEAGELNYGNH